MSTHTDVPIDVPFAEIADPGCDYELTVTAFVDLQDYSGGMRSTRAASGEFVLTAGRAARRWRLHSYEKLGTNRRGEDVAGPPIADLDGQALGADPLALLRALLSGGTA